jgi:hypothetical protein
MRWLVLACIAFGCGGPPRRSLSATWSAPPLLAHVPDDSPYVIASLEPADDMPASMLYNLEQTFRESMAAFEQLSAEERAELPGYARALLVVLDELRDKPVERWWPTLGLTRDNNFILYGYSLWPVVRFSIADPARVRSLLERVAKAGGIAVTPRRHGSGTYWLYEQDNVTVIVAIDDRLRQLIATVLHADALPEMLDHLLDEPRPANSLATTRRVPDLLAKHGLPRLSFGYIDFKLALAALTRPPSAIDKPWRDVIGEIPPGCRADFARLADAVPLVMGGFRRRDPTKFDMSFVVEVPPSVTRALAKMQTTVPALPALQRRPLFAMGIAINSERLLPWLRQTMQGWLQREARCGWLAPLDEVAGGRVAMLDAPPTMLRGVRGLTLVVDDFEPSPPSASAELLLVGDHVHELPELIGTVIPTFAGLPVAHDGKPIKLSGARLGLPWLDPAHLGVKGDRLALAIGPRSEQRVLERLGAPATRAPLLAFESDFARLNALLDRIRPDREKKDRNVEDLSVRLELREGALDFVMTGATVSNP